MLRRSVPPQKVCALEDEKDCRPDRQDKYQDPRAVVAAEDKGPDSQDITPKTAKQKETAQEKLDRDMVRWTRVVGLFTAALFVAAILQFAVMEIARESSDDSTAAQLAVMRAQTRTMQSQLDQMDIAQRPWIRLSQAAPVDISVMDAGAIIILDLHAKNVGHSPAERAYASGRAFSSLATTNEHVVAEAACKEASGRKPRDVDAIVFPGEDVPIEDGSFTINMRDIARDRSNRISEQYNAGKAYFGEEKAQTRRQQEMAQPLFTSFTIVGCITYSYRDRKAIGQTAFILDVYRRCPETPAARCTFDMSHERDYPAGDMSVSEVRSGLFAK